MKIICVCGMGIGTSILLKMNTEKALDKIGRSADVEAADIGVAKGAAVGADLVLTSEELAERLEGIPTPVKVIENFMNVDEIAEALQDALD